MTGHIGAQIRYPHEQIHAVGDMPNQLLGIAEVENEDNPSEWEEDLDTLMKDSYRETKEIEKSETNLESQSSITDSSSSVSAIPAHLRNSQRKSSIIADNMKVAGMTHRLEGHDTGIEILLD